MTTMMLDRRRAGVAAATVAVLLAIAPTAPAWASSRNKHSTSAKNHHATTGANAGGSFCQLVNEERAGFSSAVELAAGKALQAGNWKVAQKDLLLGITQTSKLVKEITASLSSAPAKIRAAANEGLKLFPAEVKAVTHSTSVSQFESAEDAATSTPKFEKTSQVLAAYQTSQCGSVTSTT